VNQVTFRLEPWGIEIRVDGRPLLDLVREAERESAAAEGYADLAGNIRVCRGPCWRRTF